MNAGLQLYTVRDELARDFRGTLQRVATIGYREVGYGGTGDMDPAAYKSFCAATGLVPLVGSVGADGLAKDAAAELARHAVIGAPYVMLGSLPESMRNSAAAWTAAGASLNAWGAAARRAGLVFQYHNHDMEFAPVGGTCGMDLLLAATDPALVKFQLDVGWVRWAGQDPVTWLKKLGPDRLRTIHLKDLVLEGAKAWTEVGTGVLDVKAVCATAAALGVEAALVEQDTCARPPLESIAVSLDNALQFIR